MKVALTLRSGAVLTGEEEDVKRLLKFTSAFGVVKESVSVAKRVETPAGVTDSVLSVRWVNPQEVVYIAEVPDG